MVKEVAADFRESVIFVILEVVPAGGDVAELVAINFLISSAFINSFNFTDMNNIKLYKELLRLPTIESHI